MTDESNVQQQIRIGVSQRGWRVWRNNVGAGKLENGSFVRWGLCNDTPAMNAQIKSADLIGIRPVVITPEMVGQTIGQFVSIECKHSAWRYTGTDREVAQRRWADMVVMLGGHAVITSGVTGIDSVVNSADTRGTLTGGGK